MIVKGYIEKSINELDSLYNKASSQKKAIYYSKLALIEYCGWIENSMDNIISTYCNSKLKIQSNKKYIKDNVIDPNYGFHYKSNFKPMLQRAIGSVALEKLEKKLERDGGKITILSSSLGSLKLKRNDAAHTFIKGTTSSFDSPSVIRTDFQRLYPILKSIDEEIRQINH